MSIRLKSCVFYFFKRRFEMNEPSHSTRLFLFVDTAKISTDKWNRDGIQGVDKLLAWISYETTGVVC